MYHSSVIEDLAWRPSHLMPTSDSRDLMLASTETQMRFQVWQMKNDFIGEDQLKMVEDLAPLIDEAEIE